MMSSEEDKTLYLPIRTGPSAIDDADHDSGEAAPRTGSSDASTNLEEQDQTELNRVLTSRSVRERTFEPIAAGDRDELHRIVSNFATGGSLAPTSTGGSALERKDTLYGVHLGDPVLNPASPEFDPYKWCRMYVQLFSWQDVDFEPTMGRGGLTATAIQVDETHGTE